MQKFNLDASCLNFFNLEPKVREPVTHELKISPDFFWDVVSQKKKFELRCNDRNFQVGDRLLLRDFQDGKYGAETVQCEISYILEDYQGLEKGYAILGLKDAELVNEN